MNTDTTKQLLQPLITRPPLTDQLLQRPPFRFLFDIVIEVSNNTNFLKQKSAENSSSADTPKPMVHKRWCTSPFNGICIDRSMVSKNLIENVKVEYAQRQHITFAVSKLSLPDAFTPKELDISSMIDKETKVAFLRKLISVLNTDGSLNHVKAGKILAGKEAEMTNLLLQKLAEDATKFWQQSFSKHPDSGEREKGKEKRIKKREKEKNANDLQQIENDDMEKDEKHHKKHREGKEQRKKRKEEELNVKDERRKDRNEDQSKETIEKRLHNGSNDDDKHKRKHKKKESSGGHHKKKGSTDNDSKYDAVEPNSDEIRQKGNISVEEKTILSNDRNNQNVKATSELNPHQEFIINNRNEQEPSGTAKTEDSGIADMQNETEVLPALSSLPELHPSVQSTVPLPTRPQTSMSRPGTAVARPAPPKLKKKQIAEIEEKPEEVKEAASVITSERNETNDDSFIMDDSKPFPDDIAAEVDIDKLSSEEHGSLVKKILETKKVLESDLQEDVHASTSLFDESQRSRHKLEVENMQKAIQQLTQTLHPLGRLFDYAQEDIDNMVQEMNEWRSERQKYDSELKKKNAKLGMETEKLLLTLKQLDDEIKEKRSGIARVRASIIENDKKIEILLNNI